ncbi:PepSY domain-containing protein [Roseicyclus amphidinii]|uniref:PepSY domain-containing protein n=1 Tax=Roseicyclus amphidinii TaxID=3034232 RepID=UPI0024E061DD|nr:PepSY domain-containing protein [Roseicyclus sp. Amp-Y-6]
MNRILPAALAIALPGMALASPDTPVSEETQTAIRTLLEAEGYEVRQIQTEDGMFEAYALKNGQRYELYIDADMQIVRTKRDD